MTENASSRPGHRLLSPWPEWASVLLLTLLGATLRLYNIGGKTLSYDEAFSLWMARHSLGEIWRLTWLVDFHPPLYYTLLHAWLVWGHSEAALRLLSALLGILTIPLTYALGRIIGGHRLGLLAGLLLAFSPFHVYYAQDARMYTLLALAATAAMWGLASLLRGHVGMAWAGQKAGPAGKTIISRRPLLHVLLPWGAYVGGSATALLSHNTAVLFLLATNLVVLMMWWRPGTFGRAFLRPWLLAQVLILVLWLIWLPSAVDQASSSVHNPWAQSFHVSRIVDAFHHLYGPRFEGLPRMVRFIKPSSILILAILAGVGLFRWRRQQHWLHFAAGLWLVAPILLMVFLPILQGSALDSRRAARWIIWTSIPASIVLAAAFTQLRGKWAAVILLGVLLVDVSALRNYYVYMVKSSKGESASYVAARARPGDAILFYLNSEALVFDYYYPRYGGREVFQRGIPADFPGTLSRFLWFPGPRMPDSYIRKLESFVRSHDRVWLIYGWGETEEPFPLARVPELTHTQRLGGGTVFLFEK